MAATADDLTTRVGSTPAVIDSSAVGTLGLVFDATAFFKDNEFDGDVVKGYSLPGFRVQPRLTFTPLPQVHLEAGLHATVYEGANKYPSYVFHDIAHWKGNEYQRGAHALPFFRAVASLQPKGSNRSHTTLVLGDIFGGTTHGLQLPLYNPELVLTDDPEMGVQLIVDRRRWHSDLWLNWQSYIYEEDTHQEAFTVGWSQRVALCAPSSGSWARGLGIPVQLVVQHRGGEQDIKELDLGVQTLANAAVGIDYEWRPSSSTLSSSSSSSVVTGVKAEASGVFCYQQSGHLWPFDTGAALWAGASVEIKRDLTVKAGFFQAPQQFCSLYGSPFFGTVSVKRENLYFDGTATGYWGVEYGRTFTSRSRSHHGTYSFGAKADGYINHGHAPFSFGVYFRVTPRFILK